MCRYIIINKKPSQKVSESLIDKIIDDRTSNPDGTGVYFYNSKLDKTSVYKFYPNEEDDVVEDALQKCFKKGTPGSLLIQHNRMATSGEKSLSQCHPIPIVHCDDYGENIYQGGYVIHNGVLTDFEIDNGINNLSDTQVIARVLGQWMYDHNVKEPADFGVERGRKFGEAMFAGSKVTIVYKDRYYTINSHLGSTEEGFGVSSKYLTYSYSYNSKDFHYGNYNTAGETDDYNMYYKDTSETSTGIPAYDPEHKEAK